MIRDIATVPLENERGLWFLCVLQLIDTRSSGIVVFKRGLRLRTCPISHDGALDLHYLHPQPHWLSSHSRSVSPGRLVL